eukprot:TRINITY_DN7847_c0_g1_i2.p1 TRINITY_DN7847_c0_g1~~TRINITY_DN7847_c0_g1_i2.p1  ORF type:complete len:324 (-),score=102.47 TRINITY_DN7847_c0_g1_i2:94-1065(-)
MKKRMARNVAKKAKRKRNDELYYDDVEEKNKITTIGKDRKDGLIRQKELEIKKNDGKINKQNNQKKFSDKKSKKDDENEDSFEEDDEVTAMDKLKNSFGVSKDKDNELILDNDRTSIKIPVFNDRKITIIKENKNIIKENNKNDKDKEDKIDEEENLEGEEIKEDDSEDEENNEKNEFSKRFNRVIDTQEAQDLQEKRKPFQFKYEFENLLIESSEERPQTYNNLGKDYALREKLVKRWRDYIKKDKNKKERNIIYNDLRFNDIQGVLFPWVNKYFDVSFNMLNHDQTLYIRETYLMHVINHLLKSKDLVSRNNYKLKTQKPM